MWPIMNNLIKKIIESDKRYRLTTRLHEIFNNYLNPKPIFVFGCQRSGTTLIQKILKLSPCIRSYGEGDKPYFIETNDGGIRLVNTDSLKQLISRESNKYILLKPLCDSQNAAKLINEFNSPAIWIYRNYTDVIDSHIKYYKYDACSYLDNILSPDINWMNEYIDKDTVDIIKNLSTTSPADCYALFWYARNSIILNIYKNTNILVINYDDLVSSPYLVCKSIYNYIDVPFMDYYSSIIYSKSYKKSVNFTLNDNIKRLCHELYIELNKISRMSVL